MLAAAISSPIAAFRARGTGSDAACFAVEGSTIRRRLPSPRIANPSSPAPLPSCFGVRGRVWGPTVVGTPLPGSEVPFSKRREMSPSCGSSGEIASARPLRFSAGSAELLDRATRPAPSHGSDVEAGIATARARRQTPRRHEDSELPLQAFTIRGTPDGHRARASADRLRGDGLFGKGGSGRVMAPGVCTGPELAMPSERPRDSVPSREKRMAGGTCAGNVLPKPAHSEKCRCHDRRARSASPA